MEIKVNILLIIFFFNIDDPHACLHTSSSSLDLTTVMVQISFIVLFNAFYGRSVTAECLIHDEK